MDETPVGKTKSQGWEFGIRRTFLISPEKAWKLLTTQPGLGIWLGHLPDADFVKGSFYATDEGTVGEILSCNRNSLLRMTWQPPDWDFFSTPQLRTRPAKTGTTIAIHHENLKNADQRAAMQRHWSGVIDQLATLINKA